MQQVRAFQFLRPPRRRRGVAMMLAIFAMVVVGTTTVAYVTSRDTSVMVAVNAQVAADARTLAASGMDLTKLLLRDGDSGWRTNHTNGRLLDNYPLDGGTVTIDLVDIERRNAGMANVAPVASTTELEVTVRSTRNGTTWESVAHMSIPSVVKGEYAIFANNIFAIYGSNNFIGRWDKAPMSAQKLRVNVGSQAMMAVWNAISPWIGSGVWIQGGANFEPEVAGANPEDPDSMKSTWIYYPYGASNFTVQGANANLVTAKKMEPADSIQMVPAPAAPAVSGAFTNYTNNLVVNNQTITYSPFRIKAALLPQLFTRNFEVHNNSVVTLNAGTYEVWGSWILRNSRIIINGDVRIVVNPNLALVGLDWENSSIELNANATLEIYNGYSMDMRNCWVGSRYICLDEPNPTLRDGDAHRRMWISGGSFTPTACDLVVPTSPRYIEPWRVRFYPISTFLGNFFPWEVRDSSVVASLFLPSNLILFTGHSRVYGRVACNHLLVRDTASFYYDHALDDVAGLTEGHAPARGGDASNMFPVRVLRYGFDAENAR